MVFVGRAHPIKPAIADGIGALCSRSRDAGRERRDEGNKEEGHGRPSSSRWQHGEKGDDGGPPPPERWYIASMSAGVTH